MLGFETLPGNTRVRTQNGLVRLDELSGSGPQGLAGPAGPEGPPGSDADTSQFYSNTQTNTWLALTEIILYQPQGLGPCFPTMA